MNEALLKERDILEEKAKLLEKQQEIVDNLPHLYGWKWYDWAWDFYNSTNRYNFLCAANQISKSSSMIRKAIHWATEPEIWPSLWSRTPTQFWYVYPSLEVATVEFEEKWVKEFLPRGEQKEKGQYSWKAHYGAGKKIDSIEFLETGVTIYFKSHEQDYKNLQTASVFAIFCDEELPAELYPELNARISAPSIKGYFHMAFTATLGQEFWRLCIEEKGIAETFKKAWKRQISCYDCKYYIDGSASGWTDEYIEELKASCSSEAEVLRRIYGRFVLDTNRKYPSFTRKGNTTPGHFLPKEWLVYAGVDIGSGGKAHPGAICFVAVNKEFTKGRVFKGWRGDGGIITTAGTILEKYLEIREKIRPVGQFYDWQSRDFKTVADSRGVPFQPADKKQDTGEALLNTLFKLEVLKVYPDEPEMMKLVLELESLRSDTPKPKAKDDFIDALRFAVTKIPWDFKAIYKLAPKVKPEKTYGSERQKQWALRKEEKASRGIDLLEAEMDLANDIIDYTGGGGDFDGGEIF